MEILFIYNKIPAGLSDFFTFYFFFLKESG